MQTILLISPYWKESHRWMVSSVKLAELWQRLGYRVIVACMGDGGEGAQNAGRRTASIGRRVNVEVLSETLTIYRKKDFFLKDPWNYGIAFGCSGMVRRIVRQEKPDHIVVNKVLFWTSLSLLSLRLRGHRVLLLTDALVGMTWWPRGRVPRMAAALYAWTIGWLILGAASRVVFFHPQPLSLLRQLGIARKSRVIPTGIDPLPFGKQVTSDRLPVTSDLPSKLETRNSKLVITYLGRLESVKGVDDFLAAAAPLTEEYPRVRVQVVGWYAKPHPLVKEYERRVTFAGLREDIPQILAATDIFVLPSYSEGLSNALMEAMASGCACIASDVGGNSFLLQNGISGFLFPPGDREALRSHLHRLIEDPAKRKAMGEAARKRIEETFSWEVVGRRYREFFVEHA